MSRTYDTDTDGGIRYTAKSPQPWLTAEQAHEIAYQYRRYDDTPELGQQTITPTQAPWDRWPISVIIHPPIDGEGAYVPHTPDDWS